MYSDMSVYCVVQMEKKMQHAMETGFKFIGMVANIMVLNASSDVSLCYPK